MTETAKCNHAVDGVISWRLFASDHRLFWCGRCGAITIATVLGVDIDWQGPQDPPVVVNLQIGPRVLFGLRKCATCGAEFTLPSPPEKNAWRATYLCEGCR